MLALALQPVDTTPFSQGICHMIIKLPAQKNCFSEKEPDFRDLIIRSILIKNLSCSYKGLTRNMIWLW